MTRNLDRDNPLKRIALNQQAVRNEERKPVLGGPRIYVGDFVGPDDPANDPLDASEFSPPWLNDFYYIEGAPIWFAHGVDGETDMGGAYDLTGASTGTPPVSGTVAFDMDLEWAAAAPSLSLFPALATAEADPADDVIIVCAQRVMPNGNVRIYWPVYAQLYVP